MSKMTNKFILGTEEVQRILSLHESFKKKTIKEQTSPKTSTVRNRQELIQFFATAKSYGCLTDQNLVYDKPFRLAGEDRGYIKGPSGSMKGKDKRVYDDFTFAIVEPSTGAVLREGKWVCKQMEPKPEPEKPTTLDQNQNKVLEFIGQDSWFDKPAPTDVEIEKGLFEKMDLTDPNSVLGRQYSKFFPKEKFPKGFFVYRQIKQEMVTPGKAEEIELTGEQCKTAINSLYRHMESPNSVPLSNTQINSYVDVAQKCAEPANRKRFRFGMNKQLEKIARKYGIEIR